MNTLRNWLILVGIGSLLIINGLAAGLATATEEHFTSLQVGSNLYTNVTVTSRATGYVFIVYDGGMRNVKVAEMTPEVQELMGYRKPEPKVQTNRVAQLAKQTITRIDSPELKQMQTQLLAAMQHGPGKSRVASWLTLPFVIGFLCGLFLVYLFMCYCSALICRKAGTEPGFLIWVPVLQMLPMLQAANMSRWWFLGFFVPVLNIVVYVMWCIKISLARGKGVLPGILLLLPVVSLFAFLYLAFADAAGSGDEQGKSESKLMVLGAA